MRTGIYPPELRSTNLDFDWIYRRPGPMLMHTVFATVESVWEWIETQVHVAVVGGLDRLAVAYRVGSLPRARDSGAAALIAIAVLTIYLIIGYTLETR